MRLSNARVRVHAQPSDVCLPLLQLLSRSPTGLAGVSPFLIVLNYTDVREHNYVQF